MRYLLAIVGAGLPLLVANASHAHSAAELIAQELRASQSISFYFVSRTGTYDYDPSEIQSAASVQVQRSCGANCHNFMSPVLASLQASEPTDCASGQQDLLITFGASQIVYSYSGRQAMYQGRCYFNPESVHQFLKANGFFFQ